MQNFVQPRHRRGSQIQRMLQALILTYSQIIFHRMLITQHPIIEEKEQDHLLDKSDLFMITGSLVEILDLNNMRSLLILGFMVTINTIKVYLRLVDCSFMFNNENTYLKISFELLGGQLFLRKAIYSIVDDKIEGKRVSIGIFGRAIF